MSRSGLSRWFSEFLGVALFSAALFSVIALATYDPADPVWFFSTSSNSPPANFAGQVGAFLAELCYQVIGFSAYLLPIVLVTVGWHTFGARRSMRPTRNWSASPLHWHVLHPSSQSLSVCSTRRTALFDPAATSVVGSQGSSLNISIEPVLLFSS